MRIRLLAVLPLAAIALVAGCTAPAPQPSPEAIPPLDMCAAAAPSGPLSESVAVAGSVGTAASVTFTEPLTIDATERTVAVEGDGEQIDANSLVDYALTAFDASTGAQLSGDGSAPATRLSVPAASIATYVGCASVGSRVVITVPPTDVDAAGIWVMDVMAAKPARADGDAQDPVDGMPSVTLDADGAPTIVVPQSDPPAENEIAVLKQGDGPTIEAGDSVMIHYTGARWSNNLVFDSSWLTRSPTAVVTTDMIPGYRAALEGHTVGSQILAVIPPSLAYGEGEINEEDLTGETLVFVVDLLEILPTP